MRGETTGALNPFALSRRLWNRWLEGMSIAADASMRSPAFLAWMQYAMRTMIEVRRVQSVWFGSWR